ncbi:hypothetical protein IMZ48_31645 [Candidatus Bathyarchaeota archaeon]|nr:hypothetical protein [Candidatus Bathyarchaeota archaeon]
MLQPPLVSDLLTAKSQKGNEDPSLSGSWSVRESFVSYALTNMPMIYPLFKRFIEKGVSMASGERGTKSGLTDSNGYRLDSYNRSAKRTKRSNIEPGLDTIMGPDETKWGSQEHIVTKTTDKGTSSGDENFSTRDSDDARRGTRRGAEAGPYAEVMIPNTSTAVHGADAPGRGNSRKWGASGRDITVTTEYSVSVDDDAAARRRAGAESPLPYGPPR